MVYGWLVPHVVFPLSERLSGRRFWTETLRLRELQWRPAEELEARAVRKLRPLLAHARAHVPYYRDLFRRVDFEPEDIRSLADLAHLPITTKADLRAAFPAGVVADNLPAGRRQKMVTSGSSGTPFPFYVDHAGRDSALASYYFFLGWAGVAVWDTWLRVVSPAQFNPDAERSPPIMRAARRVLLGERVVRLSAVDLTAAELRARLAELSPRRRYFISGYAASIARVAGELLDAGVELPVAPHVVIASGETLTAAHAAVIARAFGCRVVNRYVCLEALHMAQDCPDNPGLLHVNSERVILRVVRDDGSSAEPGQPGRVVMTPLANFVMPLINYDLGDRAVAGTACPCGRGFPTVRGLEGRTGELIRTPAGRSISPAVVCTLLSRRLPIEPYVREFQAVQTAPDLVILRVVPTARFGREVAERLAGDLEAALGPGLRVRIEAVDRVPAEPSGKRLIIKSHLPAADRPAPARP